MTIVVTIIGISLLIVLHELGHYGVARACGMRVLRFSLGFGPTLFSRQVGDTVWQVAAIPLGGYVHIHGMGPEEPVGTDGKSFRDKPVWQRALVIFAGPLANWLIAALCLSLIAVSIGIPAHDGTQPVLGEVVEGGPAADAGLRRGDQVVSVDGTPTPMGQDIIAIVRKSPAKPVAFTVIRDGTTLTITVTPELNAENERGVIKAGIEDQPYAELRQLPLGEGIVAGVRGAWRLTERQASAIWGFISRTQDGRLAGPAGIVKMIAQQAELGLSRFLQSLAMLSIGLFLLNLLPMPALDGSRLVFLGIEAVRGKPVNHLIEGWVHAVGFVLLLGLMIFATVGDLL
jgi:regulator of sigma E protease